METDHGEIVDLEPISMDPPFIIKRSIAWDMAVGKIEPLVNVHELESYRGPAQAFSSGPMYTKVDQHVEHILRVANWLLGEED